MTKEERKVRKLSRKARRRKRRAGRAIIREASDWNFLKVWLSEFTARHLLKFVNKKLGNMKGSWKTSAIGWISVVIGVLGVIVGVLSGQGFDVSPLLDSLGNVGVILPAWLIGILGIFSRDDDKTSEDVNAGK